MSDDDEKIASLAATVAELEAGLRKTMAERDAAMESYNGAVLRASELETKVNVLGAACQKMAYNWLAHSAFSRIDQYVQHAVNCGGGEIACSCGATQSISTFKAGRQAIDAALPLIGDNRR